MQNLSDGVAVTSSAITTAITISTELVDEQLRAGGATPVGRMGTAYQWRADDVLRIVFHVDPETFRSVMRPAESAA